MKPGKPLQRKTPLTAKTGLRRTTELQARAFRESLSARSPVKRSTVAKSKSASGKVQRDVGPTPEVVAAVIERERESCLICGYGVGPDERGRRWSIHHRLRRGQQVQHTVQNCILLCGGSEVDGCHQVVHANPAASREGGWLIRGRMEPLAIPVLIPLENRLVYLTSTGLYHDVRQESA